jgi:hypothetical protein
MPEKPQRPIQRYARDTNPGGSPPPLHQRIKALGLALVFIISLIVGSSTGDDTLRAICAFTCVIGLVGALYYTMKSLDDARDRGEDIS